MEDFTRFLQRHRVAVMHGVGSDDAREGLCARWRCEGRTDLAEMWRAGEKGTYFVEVEDELGDRGEAERLKRRKD